jgi:hypothetical protein
MRYDAEILNEFRQIIDALRQKKMTQQEALRRLREIGNEIELDQWQIIEDLRTRAPENQRELARELTDLLAAELGKEEATPSPPPAAPPPVRWGLYRTQFGKTLKLKVLKVSVQTASLKLRALNIAATVKFMMFGGEG